MTVYCSSSSPVHAAINISRPDAPWLLGSLFSRLLRCRVGPKNGPLPIDCCLRYVVDDWTNGVIVDRGRDQRNYRHSSGCGSIVRQHSCDGPPRPYHIFGSVYPARRRAGRRTEAQCDQIALRVQPPSPVLHRFYPWDHLSHDHQEDDLSLFASLLMPHWKSRAEFNRYGVRDIQSRHCWL